MPKNNGIRQIIKQLVIRFNDTYQYKPIVNKNEFNFLWKNPYLLLSFFKKCIPKHDENHYGYREYYHGL